MVRCPAHEDQTPSLSITEQAGKVLVFCHAGCKQEDVVDGLRHRGLWNGSESGRSGAAFNGTGGNYVKRSSEVSAELVHWKLESKGFRLVDTFNYGDRE